MLIYNEGVPGSGKSYDAVLTHIVPAIRSGRKVYARLNGLSFEKIAEYLQIDVARVRALLILLDDSDVLALPDREDLKDALIVIDEAHEFYVASREPMPKPVEELFAKHRHHGLDILLISQFFKRIHGAVRGRIERKYTFQKLTAVGATSRYTVRQFATVGPDKFEQVDIQTKKYDPAIFPLYQSVAPGTANLETYAQGSSTAWRKIGMYAAIMVPLGVVSIYFLASFFAGDVDLVEKKSQPGVSSASKTSSIPPRTAVPDSVLPAKKSGPDLSMMPPAVAYIFDIATRARPRLAGVMIGPSGRPAGIVEFRAERSIMESITFNQLSAMGFKVTVKSWGVLLEQSGQSIVATNWPVPREPDQPSDPAVPNNADGRRMPSASEPYADRMPPKARSESQTEPAQSVGPFGPYVPPATVL